MATEARIGTRIRRARERKRMSQSDLAEALGVSRSAVNAWENDRALPQSSIGALEQVLGISIDEPPAPRTEEEAATALEAQAAELVQAARRIRAAAARAKNDKRGKDEDEEPERGARRRAV